MFIPHFVPLLALSEKDNPPPPTDLPTSPPHRRITHHTTPPLPAYPLLRHWTLGRDLGLVLFFSPTSPAGETLAGATSGCGNAGSRTAIRLASFRQHGVSLGTVSSLVTSSPPSLTLSCYPHRQLIGLNLGVSAEPLTAHCGSTPKPSSPGKSSGLSSGPSGPWPVQTSFHFAPPPNTPPSAKRPQGRLLARPRPGSAFFLSWPVLPFGACSRQLVSKVAAVFEAHCVVGVR